MSRYSGKCDLADHIEICGGFERFKESNPEVYIGDSKTPLVFNKESELMPYYPYVIGISACSNDNQYIRLTSKSWVDIEAEKYGELSMHQHYRDRLSEDIKKKITEENRQDSIQ